MKMHLFAQSVDGSWVPAKADQSGALIGGGSGSGTISGGGDVRTRKFSYAGPNGGITDTADDVIAAAPGVGSANYLQSLQLANSSATATEVVIKSASTVIWRGYAPAQSVAAPVHFDPPLGGVNNEALNVACITNATATIVSAQGYTDFAVAQLEALETAGEEIFADDGSLLLDDSGNTLYLN